MPSIMVYTNRDVFKYLYEEAQKTNSTPAKIAAGILNDFVTSETMITTLENQEEKEQIDREDAGE
jgi:hypothetical protein